MPGASSASARPPRAASPARPAAAALRAPGARAAAPERGPALDRASIEPLYRQLAARLGRAIDDGTLAPGARLPSEPELMAEHAVSRVTVRQAIAALQREGRVAARRGKGTFVLGSVVRHDLDALRGFRDVLLDQGHRPRTELVAFGPDTGASDGPRPVDLDLPVRLERRYALDGRPFALVVGWLPRAAAAIGRARADRLAIYQILDEVLGLRVARADVTIRSQRAAPAVARQLGLPRGGQVLVMERRSSTPSGDACECTRIHIVPDRFEFRLGVPGPLEIAPAIRPVGGARAGARR